MDPNATLKTISEALALKDTECARELALGLRDWLARGGFEPDWERHPRAAYGCFGKRSGGPLWRFGGLGHRSQWAVTQAHPWWPKEAR